MIKESKKLLILIMAAVVLGRATFPPPGWGETLTLGVALYAALKAGEVTASMIGAVIRKIWGRKED